MEHLVRIATEIKDDLGEMKQVVCGTMTDPQAGLIARVARLEEIADEVKRAKKWLIAIGSVALIGGSGTVVKVLNAIEVAGSAEKQAATEGKP